MGDGATDALKGFVKGGMPHHQPTRPCKACNGTGAGPDVIEEYIDVWPRREPTICKFCRGKGYVKGRKQ